MKQNNPISHICKPQSTKPKTLNMVLNFLVR